MDEATVTRIENAAFTPASATVDGQSATARSADDVMKLADGAQNRRAVRTKRTGWGGLYMAKSVPPGGQ